MFEIVNVFDYELGLDLFKLVWLMLIWIYMVNDNLLFDDMFFVFSLFGVFC